MNNNTVTATSQQTPLPSLAIPGECPNHTIILTDEDVDDIDSELAKDNVMSFTISNQDYGQPVNALPQNTNVVSISSQDVSLLQGLGETLRKWTAEKADTISKDQFECLRSIALKVRRSMEKKQVLVADYEASECDLMRSLVNRVKFGLIQDGSFMYQNRVYKVSKMDKAHLLSHPEVKNTRIV